MLISVHALVDPRKPEDYRYIGKTKKQIKKRISEHIADCNRGCKTYRNNWIRSLLNDGIRPVGILLEITFSDGAKEEIAAIKFYKKQGHKLTNGTIGGEGCIGMSQESKNRRVKSRAWYKHSDEIKAKIGALKKGKPLHENSLKALKIASNSKENKERLLKISKDRIGKKRDSTFCEKASIGHKKSWDSGNRRVTQEMRDRFTTLNISRKGQPLSNEHKRKVGEASKKVIRTPEWKANISAGVKANWIKRHQEEFDKDEIQV